MSEREEFRLPATFYDPPDDDEPDEWVNPFAVARALSDPEAETPTTEELGDALHKLRLLRQSFGEMVADLEIELAARLGDGRHLVGDRWWEVGQSVRRRSWDSDTLRREAMKWARFDPATGEEVDALTALERIASLFTLSGSTVRVGQIRTALGRAPDEYAEEEYVVKVREL